MHSNRPGVARMAITAALTLSMSLGGVPTISFAEPSTNDVAQGHGSVVTEASELPRDEQAAGEDQVIEVQTARDRAAQEAAQDQTAETEALGDDTSQDTGTWGTCPWEFKDGTLTVSPGALQVYPKPWGTSGAVSPEEVKAVVFMGEGDQRVVCPEDLGMLLVGLDNLESVDLSGLDTSSTVDMNCMFFNLTALKTIVGLDALDTSNVTDMSSMFWKCSALSELDVSGLQTQSVQTMRAMFYSCLSLKEIKGLDTLDTSRVTDFNGMFQDCSGLESMNLSAFNTAAAQDMSCMFYACSSLEELDLSSFNTSHVTSMYAMFHGCERLARLNVSSFDVGKVTVFTFMFYNCSALEGLDVATWDTSSAIDAGFMFQGCRSLKSLDVSGWRFPIAQRLYWMFYGCESLEALDVAEWGVASLIEADGIFAECSLLKTLDFSSWDTTKVEGISHILSACSSLQKITLSEKTKPFGDLPSYEVNGHRDWLSAADETWYTSDEIVSKRLGIADTYTKGQTDDDDWDGTVGRSQDGTTRSINTYVQRVGDAPVLKWSNGDEVAASLLTKEELARFNNGEDASVWVSISIATTETNEYTSMMSIVDNKLVTAGVGASTTYDITLWKQVGKDDPTQITDTGDSVLRLEMQVPDAYINGDSSIERTYYLFRFHQDEKSGEVAYDQMAETSDTTIGFGSNLFSYYALIYVDSKVDEIAGSGGTYTGTTTTYYSSGTTGTSSTSSGNTAANTTTTRTPDTGDSSIPGAAAIVVAGVALVLAGVWRKRQSK